MRTYGGILIFAAVWLRALVDYAGEPVWIQVQAFLLLYGILLLVGLWSFQRHPALVEGARIWKPQAWLPLLYLAAQSGLTVALLSVDPKEDFFADLFIPLSLQAVLYFRRRHGFLLIALFSLAMAFPLLASDRGQVFGLAMTGLYCGVCFLFGGYADQVVKAETARSRNQATLSELQAAHSQLLDYAAQLEDLTSEQERNRLARELHDSVTQTVFSMNLASQSASLLLPRDPVRTAEQLQQIEALAGSAMREIQTLISQLRPVPLLEAGLLPALQRLAVERRTRDGLEVNLEVSGERPLPAATVAGLYRIVQEALNNAAKHSGCSQVTVRLDLASQPSRLEIEDRGRGFDPQAALGRRGHLGLAGMFERARELGWKLSIDSHPGAGTLIRAVEADTGGAS